MRGTDSAFAADSKPCPRSKSPIAAFLASMSCFTLKSTRIKSLPFLMSKKWEAVQVRSGGSFMSEDALGSYPMRPADNYVALD